MEREGGDSPARSVAVAKEMAAERGEPASGKPADSELPPLRAESTVLRDYSADSRMLVMAALGALMGVLAAILAWIVIRMIGLATNLFYFHQWSFQESEPAQHALGWWAVFIPAIGGLLVGLIARFGSPMVRGHGMPEAIEAVVFGGARVKPRVAILKPLATAISIGSGGPFGAEGPVIATGGALGSLLAQFLPVTDAERSVLLVSGASAGMAAAFACPLSGVLLAVELLLFEWRPRSLVPVTVACATAGFIRHLLLGPGPIFAMPATGYVMTSTSMLGALLLGVMMAVVAWVLNYVIHAVEEMYEHLPVHWMWYPAIGGLVVGIGGLIFPQALGTGYGVIRQFVAGNFTWKLIVAVLVVKTLVWIVSLSSNTAGGVLAPLLLIGGAAGAAMSHWIPSLTPGAWVVVGMTSLLAASIGAPLMSSVLAVELTHNGGILLPVLLACTVAYALTVLFQPRSLVTAGLSRKGRHLAREYGVDPLEMVLVRDAMHTSVYALPAGATRADAVEWLRVMLERGASAWSHWQGIFPVVDENGSLLGILTRSQMIAAAEGTGEGSLLQWSVAVPEMLPASATLRVAAERMGASGLTSYPVVDADGHFAGILGIADLLTARVESARREGDRNQILRVRWPFRRTQP